MSELLELPVYSNFGLLFNPSALLIAKPYSIAKN